MAVIVIITRRRSCSFAEYCKHFVARFNDVHVFSYAPEVNGWMKFGTLRINYLDLALIDYWRDPRRSESGSANRNFVFFCLVSTRDFIDFRSAKFHEICTQDVDLCPHESFRKTFLKICPKGVFFRKREILLERRQRLPTSGRDFSEMNTNLGRL